MFTMLEEKKSCISVQAIQNRGGLNIPTKLNLSETKKQALKALVVEYPPTTPKRKQPTKHSKKQTKKKLG